MSDLTPRERDAIRAELHDLATQYQRLTEEREVLVRILANYRRWLALKGIPEYPIVPAGWWESTAAQAIAYYAALNGPRRR